MLDSRRADRRPHRAADDDRGRGAGAARDRGRALGLRPAEARAAGDRARLVARAQRALRRAASPGDGGLASRRTLAQSTRPDKQLYRITAGGRAALEQWLETVEPGARETFFLKLFVGALTTPDVLLEHVEQFVADTGERLAELRAIEPTNTNRGHDWFHRHMLRYGIEQAERELDWAGGVGRALKRGPR